MKRWSHYLGLLALAGVLWGCAGMGGMPQQPDHSFSFDGQFDGWAKQVDLLEYRYGSPARTTGDSVKPGSTSLGYRSPVISAMPAGEFLFVKWRIKATGEVLEDRVDLRPLLPRSMDKQTVTFVIDGRQLYIYLVTGTLKPYMAPPILKTYLSKSTVTFEIYPRNTRPQ